MGVNVTVGGRACAARVHTRASGPPQTSRAWTTSARRRVKPRVAVASSGLGHVARGIESWAEDTARSLRREECHVTLFRAFGASTEPGEVTLRCLRRGEPRTGKLVRLLRRGGWRFRLQSTYGVEQASFALALWSRVCLSYDVVHVQDPMIAYWMQRLRRCGLSRPRVILANGTQEGPDFLGLFDFVQHLSPPLSESPGGRERSRARSEFVIPNPVDVDRFSPRSGAARRSALGIGPGEVLVMCAAALNEESKRVATLIREFAAFCGTRQERLRLLVAGATEPGSESIVELGKTLLGDRVRFLTDVPRDEMAGIYAAADLFAMPSLFEAFGTALLEAMACGLPVVCHNSMPMSWVAGGAADPCDISGPDGLARQWSALLDPKVRAHRGAFARRRAVEHFSTTVVVRQILDMYGAVCSAGRPRAGQSAGGAVPSAD